MLAEIEQISFVFRVKHLIIVKKVSSQDDKLNSVLPIKLFPKIKLNQEDDSTVLTFKSPVQSHL